MERFWSKVDRSQLSPGGCWEWTASTSPKGYGKFSATSRRWDPAHRWAWALAVGPIPAGSVVRHRCDTRRCCNPAHLQLGTPGDNNRDTWERGRGNPKGLITGQRMTPTNAKLTAEQAARIKWLLAEGAGQFRICSKVAKAEGVHVAAVHSINRGQSWRWVSPCPPARTSPDPAPAQG
jgi:hypothetical protein